MAVVNFTEDLQFIIRQARFIAISCGHEYIHTDHLFMAMLRHNCLASAFFEGINADRWEHEIKGTHHATFHYGDQDNLPLTQEADRAIRHAAGIADAMKENTFNTVHLVLALLSYENPIKGTIEGCGWLFDHIVEQYTGSQDQFYPPLPDLGQEKPVSAIAWAFISKEKKHKKLAALYEHANVLKSYDALGECIKVCRTALTLSPGNAAFMQILAYSLYKTDDYSGLTPLLDSLLAIPSHKEWALYMRAEMNTGEDNYTSLIALLKQLLEKSPDDLAYLNNLGYCLSQQQLFSSAAPYLEKAIQINPDYAFAHCNLGYALFKLGNIQAGIAAINKSLSLNKSNCFAYKHLGVIYLERGDKHMARQNLQLALKYKYTALYGDEVLTLLQQLDD